MQNADLLIKLGGDTRLFDKAVDNMRREIDAFSAHVKKKAPSSFSSFAKAAGDAAKEFKKLERASEVASNKIRREMSEALFNTSDFRRLSAKQKEMLVRYEGMWKQTTNEVAAQQKRVDDYLFQRRMRNIRRERQAKLDATRDAQRGNNAQSGTTRLGHAIGTTALYGGVAQALFGLQAAFAATVKEAMVFNDALYANMAVLNVNKETSKGLISVVKELGSAYGGNFSDIQEGLITLGRAGVDAGEGLATATKVVREMALITGDSMKEGADVMSSFINVFNNKTAEGVQHLGDKMMYVANATRLSLKDFSTFSNYALVTAQSLGLTETATLGLAGAFSKVGLNASTIGTSIARLGKILLQETKATKHFFREVGISQDKLRRAIAQGGEVGEKALQGFMNQLEALRRLDNDRFMSALKAMPELMKRTVIAAAAAGGEFGFLATQMREMNGEMKSTDEAAALLAKGFTPTMERLRNNFLTVSNGALQPLLQDIADMVNAFLGDGVNAVQTLDTWLQNLITTFKAAAMGLGAFLAIKVVGVVHGWITSFSALNGVLLTTGAMISRLAGIAGVVVGLSEFGKGVFENAQQKYQSGGHTKAEVEATHKRQKDELAHANSMETKYAEQGNLLRQLQDMKKNIKGTEEQRAVILDTINKKEKSIKDSMNTLQGEINTKYEKGIKLAEKKAIASKKALLGALGFDPTEKQKLMQMEVKLNKEILAGTMTKRQVEHKMIDARIKAAKEYNTELKKTKFNEDARIKGEKALVELQLRKKKMNLTDSERAAADAKREVAKNAKASTAGAARAARLQDKLSKDAISLLEAKMKLEQAMVDMEDAKNSQLFTQVQLDAKALKIAKEKLAIAKKYKAAAIKEGMPSGDKGKKKLVDLEIKVTKAQEEVNKKAIAAWDRVIKDLKSAGDEAFNQLMSLDFKGALETLTGGFLDSMLKPMRDYFSTTFAGMFKQDGAIGGMLGGMFGGGGKEGEEGGLLSSLGGWGAIAAAAVAVAGSLFENKAAKDLEKAQKQAMDNATANSETIEKSLETLADIGTLGLKHSGKMVSSLQTIADMTLISAKSMGGELSGKGYTDVTEKGFFNDSSTKLFESGISLDKATIDQINSGQMTASKYMVEVTENSGFLGIGSSTESNRTNMGDANGAIMAPITEAYRQGVEVIRSASAALGVSTEEFKATSAAWETSVQDLNFKGMDAAERAQLIQGAIAGDMDRWASSLESLQPTLEKFAHDGEASGEALIRIVTTYELAEKAMRDMGASLDPLVEGGYEVADAMIKAAGGMEKFAKGVKDFQDAFMTDAQKQAVLQRDLAISSTQIGLSLPQTAQGMLDLHNRLMQLSATSPIAAEQLRWLNANVADLARMVEYAGSKAGSAAGAVGGCGSALNSCGSAASSCAKDVEEFASALDFLSAQSDFHARKLALEDDDEKSAEYAIKASKAMLAALKVEHNLGHLTLDNYEKQLAAAYKAGGLTDEMLSNYTSIGSALLDVAEAEKALHDLRKQIELDKVNNEVAFYEGIFKKIKGAFTGPLSPYNTREKAAQQHAFSNAYYDTGTTNEQGYFDSLYKELEYEKKMSVTKEAYGILFDEYINDLKNVQYVEDEKTTNDVVKELEEANKKLDDLTDSIEKASYK